MKTDKEREEELWLSDELFNQFEGKYPLIENDPYKFLGIEKKQAKPPQQKS